MSPDIIDVTEYVESGQYHTDSCKGKLEKLIRIKPFILDGKYETQLQNKLVLWKQHYNSWLLENKRDTLDFYIVDLVKKTTYQYSYFITSEPIDVFRTDTDIKINGIGNLKLFLQIDKDSLIISNYNENGWVIDDCDSANSIIQDLY